MTSDLRERKKEATRQALHHAAVRLALEHGVEGVTVEAISEAAMVSRRTFSNYFTGKEQALLYHDRTHVAHLVNLVRARPPEEPPGVALVNAAAQLGAMFSDPAEHARYRDLRTHPALAREFNAVYSAAEQDLAAALEERLPAPTDRHLRAQVLATAFLATLRVVLHRFTVDPEQDTTALIHQAVSVLHESFE